ncbi:hypothetical protein [Allocoleopsis sp.]|uniref:hypothetical protein n=1 Tax=Allocoleopsis sp. TaxID=3088169 RepID=UPI002FD267D8
MSSSSGYPVSWVPVNSFSLIQSISLWQQQDNSNFALTQVYHVWPELTSSSKTAEVLSSLVQVWGSKLQASGCELHVLGSKPQALSCDRTRRYFIVSTLRQ